MDKPARSSEGFDVPETEAMKELSELTGAMRSGRLFFASPSARLLDDLISPYRRGSEWAGVV